MRKLNVEKQGRSDLKTYGVEYATETNEHRTETLGLDPITNCQKCQKNLGQTGITVFWGGYGSGDKGQGTFCEKCGRRKVKKLKDLGAVRY